MATMTIPKRNPMPKGNATKSAVASLVRSAASARPKLKDFDGLEPIGGSNRIVKDVVTRPSFRLISDELLDKYFKKLIKSIRLMQKCLNEFNFSGIVLDYSAIKDSFADREGWREIFWKISQNKVQGIADPYAIVSAITVLRAYFDPKLSDRDILSWGTTQLGKTMLFCLLFYLIPALSHVLHHTTVLPFISTPNFNNISEGTKAELDQILKVYGKLEIIRGDRSTTFKKVVENQEDAFGNNTIGFESQVNKRYRSRVEKFVEKVKTLGKNVVVVNFTDEIHFGSQRDGCSDIQERETLAMKISEVGLPIADFVESE
ncbi:unnamed protein product [Sphagnum jensenii]|uniref:Uncharacterized protein n=1 Tax=Sphagnum jensenii TaxID=128206 RepID=A0ABP0VA10_9BRYO